MMSNSKSYVCPVCGRALSSPGSLGRHLLIHSEDRLSNCAVCGARFTDTNNFNRFGSALLLWPRALHADCSIKTKHLGVLHVFRSEIYDNEHGFSLYYDIDEIQLIRFISSLSVVWRKIGFCCVSTQQSIMNFIPHIYNHKDLGCENVCNTSVKCVVKVAHWRGNEAVFLELKHWSTATTDLLDVNLNVA